MGAFWTSGEQLTGELIDLVGYKLGLAITGGELRSALARADVDTTFADLRAIRMRAEEYEELAAVTLAQFGDVDAVHRPLLMQSVIQSLNPEDIPFALQVIDKALPMLGTEILTAAPGGSLDTTSTEAQLGREFGPQGIDVFRRLLAAMAARQLRDPWSKVRRQEWPDLITLGDLFSTEQTTASLGSFFDQRLINYLRANFEDIDVVNWRRFEALTAEFFDRLGMIVELGPGRGDDGIDVRAWSDSEAQAGQATIVIQCKRERRRINQAVIKALAADVEFEGAELGLLVTTSSLAPSARAVVKTRGYPILEADRDAVHRWIELMRTPGVGDWMIGDS